MTACNAQQLGRLLSAACAAAGPALHVTGPGALHWRGQALRALSQAAGTAEQPSSTSTISGSSSSSSADHQATSSSPNSSGSASGSSLEGNSAGSSTPDGYKLMYEGLFARPHKRLKYASLLNTFASCAAAPYIITYSTAAPMARVAVTVSVLLLAFITTGGLHWFTSPYVHQLMYNDKTDVAKVQTLRLLGGSRWHEFPVSSVEAPTGYHPLASFKVNGKTFYVDTGNFEDLQLLTRLTGSSTESDGQQEPEQLCEGAKQD